jgi:hypothetical protein
LVYVIGYTKEKAPRKQDVYDINDIPQIIKDLGEITKAMYTGLKNNPERELESSDLAEEIMRGLPKTFEGRSMASISYATVWAGDTLRKKD